MKRVRKKTVPATTNNITKAVINFLNLKGHFAFRVNNGAVFDPIKRVFRKRSKDDPAISDVHCTLCPSGVSLWIEIKNSHTKDRATKKQNEFAENIKRCGGMHYFLRAFDEFIAWYNDNIYDNTDEV